MLKKIIGLLCTSLLLLSSLTGPALAAGIPSETNPFESIDHTREKVLTAMTAQQSGQQDASLAAQTQKVQQATEALAARQPRYLVKFKDDVSLQEIYDGIKNYEFTVIGNSSHRTFTIDAANINAVKSAFGDKIQYTEEDKLIQSSAVTTDPYVQDQWALPALKIPEAWANTKGSNDVYVAVIDSGWDHYHEDLEAADIRMGYDYIQDTSCEWDSTGHGTSVTGIIAATANNAKGISGVCWNVAVIPLLVTYSDGSMSVSNTCAALYDAADIGADVINMSYGSDTFTLSEITAIQYALSMGCILVAAAGNDGSTEYSFPASYDGVVSAGSINSSLLVSSFSQKNDRVDVAAPGEGVLSTTDPYYKGGYSYYEVNGTSFASPYVAGIAALVRTLDDSIDSFEFEEIVQRTATDKGAAGYDTAYGYGIVNAQAVLNDVTGAQAQYTITASSNNASYGTVTGTGVYAAGTSATVKAIPSAGYRFVRWLEGSAAVSTSPGYKFTVTKARTLKAEFAKIGTPTVTAVPSGSSSVKLTWAAVAGAVEYEIYRTSSSSGTYTKIGTTASTSYTDTGLAVGATYYYKVRAKCAAGSTVTYGAHSAAASAKILPVPASVKAASAGYNSVKLTWGAAAGATAYEVYRATSSAGTYTKQTEITSTSYTSTGLTTGTTYYYKVRAKCVSGSTTTYSSYSAAVAAKPVPATPASFAAASASYNSVKLTWAAVTGATQYEVYRATSSAGTYTKLTETLSASYTNASLTTGTTYYYKVRAYRTVGSTKVYGGYTAAMAAKPIPATPASPKAASASYNSIKVTWGAVTGASGYEVYRATSSSGTYSKITTLTSGSTVAYTNTSLTTGATYYYKVRAYRTVGSTKVYGGYTSAVSTKPVPAVPTGVKAARASATSVKVSWSAVAGAMGYEVYRATSSGGTYTLVKAVTTLNLTNAGLVTGKTYYYKVRAYRTVGSTKVYGGYSAVVYVKP